MNTDSTDKRDFFRKAQQATQVSLTLVIEIPKVPKICGLYNLVSYFFFGTTYALSSYNIYIGSDTIISVKASEVGVMNAATIRMNTTA